MEAEITRIQDLPYLNLFSEFFADGLQPPTSNLPLPVSSFPSQKPDDRVHLVDQIEDHDDQKDQEKRIGVNHPCDVHTLTPLRTIKCRVGSFQCLVDYIMIHSYRNNILVAVREILPNS